MKKKVLALLLPLTAGVALTGTGFGVWVFDNSIGKTVSGDIGLTSAIEAKGLEITNKDTVEKITLDQTDDSHLWQDIKFKLNFDSSKGIKITSGIVTVKFQLDCEAVLPKKLNETTGSTDKLDDFITLSEVTVDSDGFTLKSLKVATAGNYSLFNGVIEFDTSKFEDANLGVNPVGQDYDMSYTFGLNYQYNWKNKPTTSTGYNTIRDILGSHSTIDYKFTAHDFIVDSNALV